MSFVSESVKVKAMRLIKEGEGLRLEKYLDTKGLPTIGYGHLILKNQNFDQGLTPQQAQQLLKSDFNKKTIPEVINYWDEVLEELSQARIAVLIDMTFNLGSLKAWVKLTEAIEEGDFDEAAKQIMQSKYATQVGRRARRNMLIMRDNVLYNCENMPQN